MIYYVCLRSLSTREDVVVTIWDEEEEKFCAFLETFCLERHLSFRDPRVSS
jgi:hypothetical protein